MQAVDVARTALLLQQPQYGEMTKAGSRKKIPLHARKRTNEWELWDSDWCPSSSPDDQYVPRTIKLTESPEFMKCNPQFAQKDDAWYYDIKEMEPVTRHRKAWLEKGQPLPPPPLGCRTMTWTVHEDGSVTGVEKV
eukprot:2789154-Amphidinium_carterae.9